MNISTLHKLSASLDCNVKPDTKSEYKGTLKSHALWTVFPKGNKVAAIPVNAIEQTFLLFPVSKLYKVL